MATGILPNADITSNWTPIPVGTHYTTVDEYVVNTADYVYAISYPQGIETFGFPDTIDDVDEVTQIVVNVYYSTVDADEAPTGSCTIDVYLGGWLGTKSFTKPKAGGWQAFTWAGLSGSQADLDGLQVKFNAVGLGSGKYLGDVVSVHAVNVDVTYTPTAGGGWGHKVNGVLPANIGKINGVLTANIGKVNGV